MGQPMNPITTARWIYQCICEDDYELAQAHADALAEFQDEGSPITQRAIDFLKQAILQLEHKNWRHPWHQTLFTTLTKIVNDERERGDGTPSRPVPIVDNVAAIARAMRRIEREGGR